MQKIALCLRHHLYSTEMVSCSCLSNLEIIFWPFQVIVVDYGKYFVERQETSCHWFSVIPNSRQDKKKLWFFIFYFPVSKLFWGYGRELVHFFSSMLVLLHTTYSWFPKLKGEHGFQLKGHGFFVGVLFFSKFL